MLLKLTHISYLYDEIEEKNTEGLTSQHETQSVLLTLVGDHRNWALLSLQDLMSSVCTLFIFRMFHTEYQRYKLN